MSGGLRASVSRAAASHRRAAVRGAVTMAVTGLCLLAAPAAHADLDDVLDTLIGGPGAGVDSAQAADADTQPGTVNLGAFNDPLAQLARLFGDAPAAPDETDQNTGGGAPQSENTDSGDDSSNLPKPSTPSSGSGGGGGGNGSGSGNSGSGNHSGSHAKAKAHSNSAKAATGLHKADVDDNR